MWTIAVPQRSELSRKRTHAFANVKCLSVWSCSIVVLLAELPTTVVAVLCIDNNAFEPLQ